MGVDFAWGDWENATWRQALVDYWNAGGLIEVSWHAQNPWTQEEGDTGFSSVNLPDLWTPGNSAYARWHSMLDTIATRLLWLKARGVIVLWRPFHEMNGQWMWWEDRGQSDFVRLWREEHDYFAAKGLDNLLWVYSPNRQFSPLRSVDYYYPGAAYVDICGVDHYGDEWSSVQRDVTTLASFGKPVVLGGEFGPGSGGSEPVVGTFNYANLPALILANAPQVKMFMAWNGNYAIVKQRGAIALMTDARAITRDKITAPVEPPPVTPALTATITAKVSHYWWWWKVTLTWKTTGAASARISGLGSVALSGSKSIIVRGGMYTYTLSATAADGPMATAYVNIFAE